MSITNFWCNDYLPIELPHQLTDAALLRYPQLFRNALELGIDIGTVDLVCQIGSPRSIAVALQRIGRSGHWVGARPHGRIFATTREIYWVFWLITVLIVPLAAWLWLNPAPPTRAAPSAGSSSTMAVVPLLLMVLAFVFYVGAELGFSNWIYTYALTLKLADTITAAYLTSAYWAVFTASRLLGVWVSTRLRSRTILFLDFAGCLVSLALIGLARDSVPMLWVGTIGLGLSTASVFPTLILLAGERLHVTGTITGLFLVGSGAGSMLLPWLIGLAFTSISPHAMITILFVDVVLGLATVALFVYGRSLEREPAALAE